VVEQPKVNPTSKIDIKNEIMGGLDIFKGVNLFLSVIRGVLR
jgi:hypothetical protein